MPTSYTDYGIVCGLSPTGGWDGVKETDWYTLGIPVQAQDIWEFQFQCCHKSPDPNATVIGSYVMYNPQGVYVGTTPGPAVPLTDSTAWQQYTFQYQFTGNLYVFPAIWWHGTSVLNARYLCGVQVARTQSVGVIVTGAIVVPDILLVTAGAEP